MEEKQTDNQITFYNKISPNFKEIHVDGAYGGVTPKGHMNLNFYAERFPIPKSIKYNIKDKSSTKSEDSLTGIIREFEVGIYMDIEVARQVSDFLIKKLEEIDKITKSK